MGLKETFDAIQANLNYELEHPPQKNSRDIPFGLTLIKEYGFNPTTYLIVPENPNIRQKFLTYFLVRSGCARFALIQDSEGRELTRCYNTNPGEVLSW